MPSPFPGMDPYLEQPHLWPDFHHSLITYIRDALQPQLRPKYRARIEERLYVVQSGRRIYPDVTVVEHRLRERPSVAQAPAAPLSSESAPDSERPAGPDQPITLVLSDDEIREPFIELVHLESDTVVTVIELLSPANKTAGPGRDLYRQKQQEVLHSEAHLVEIDLLSQGEPTIALPPDRLALLPPHRYRVSVCYGPGHFKFDIYPIPLAQRLPRCRIPLRPPDEAPRLDLPALFTRAYDNGGYEDLLAYDQPPPVPLTEAEADWWAEEAE